MSTTSAILQWIDSMHEPNWGYVIYRCTYGDDDAWNKTFARVRTHVERSLKREEHGEKALEKLDWVVQESVELGGADTQEIRRRFNDLCNSWHKSEGFGTRYEICLIVDDESMKSILARSPEEDERDGPRRSPAFLKAVDRKYSPDESYDNETYTGEMKVTAYSLPRLYVLALDEGMATWYPGQGVTFRKY